MSTHQVWAFLIYSDRQSQGLKAWIRQVHAFFCCAGIYQKDQKGPMICQKKVVILQRKKITKNKPR